MNALMKILCADKKAKSKFKLVNSDIEFVSIDFNDADSKKINEKAEAWFVCGKKLIIYCAFVCAEDEF